MSPRATTQLRDTVAAELAQLTTAGGTAAPSSDRATHRVYQNDPRRALLHKQVINDYLSVALAGPGPGGRAVITAGPAGAGKSTAINTVLGERAALYRRLDADIVKDALLTHAASASIIDDLLTTTLNDGWPIAPRELASLVHHESTQIWDTLRRHCIDRGEPIVIEGTLDLAPTRL